MTHSGHCIDMDDLQPSDIRPMDIIHSLAALPRYAGHTATPYTVGQHTCATLAHASLLEAGRAVERSILLHDWHESFTSDIPGPVKKYLQPALDKLETHIDSMIAIRMGISEIGTAYRPFDQAAYFAEMDVLRGQDMGSDPDARTMVRRTKEMTPLQVRARLSGYLKLLFPAVNLDGGEIIPLRANV
jgi:5'-deoxynucleotidase YfbR-like HD superfamily hydrolase